MAMMRHKAYQFRIYPTKAQQVLIAKTIGGARFVFNHFLAKWDKAYKETGKGLSYGTCSAGLPALKRQAETDWLKEVDSMALQSAVRHLSEAYDRFFKQQNHAPRFKSKRHPVQSYTTRQISPLSGTG